MLRGFVIALLALGPAVSLAKGPQGPPPPGPLGSRDPKVQEPRTVDVDALRRGCDEGNMQDCGTLADLYAYGRQVGQDLARAAELYDRACRGGDTASCGSLARLLVKRGDTDAGRSLYEQACDAGDGKSCLALGRMWQGTEGGTQDLEGAAEYYDRACQAGAAVGCMVGGDIYRCGQGVAPDPSRALALFEKGCELDQLAACIAAASMCEGGEAGTPDLERAAALRARATELGALPQLSAAGSAARSRDCMIKAAARARHTQPEEVEAVPVEVEPPAQPVAELLAQLRNGRPVERRIKAAWELARATRVGAEGVAELEKALASDNERLREAAAWALGNLEDPEAQASCSSSYDSRPEIVKQEKPRYPQEAFTKGVMGAVMIKALIGADGRVVHAAVTKSIPRLDAAALACVRHYTFRPATRNSRPTPVTVLAPVRFKIY